MMFTKNYWKCFFRAVKVAIIVTTLLVNGTPVVRSLGASSIPIGFFNGATALNANEKEIVAQELLQYLEESSKDNYKSLVDTVIKNSEGPEPEIKAILEKNSDNKKIPNAAYITDISLVEDAIVVTGRVSAKQNYRIVVRNLNFQTGVAEYSIAVSEKEFPSAKRIPAKFINETHAGLLSWLMGTPEISNSEKNREIAKKNRQEGRDDPTYGIIQYEAPRERGSSWRHYSGVDQSRYERTPQPVSSPAYTPAAPMTPMTTLKIELIKSSVAGVFGIIGATIPLLVGVGVAAPNPVTLGVIAGVAGGLVAAGALAYTVKKSYEFYKDEKTKIAQREKYLSIFGSLKRQCDHETTNFNHFWADLVNQRLNKSTRMDTRYLPSTLYGYTLLMKMENELPNRSHLNREKFNYFRYPADREKNIYAPQIEEALSYLDVNPASSQTEKGLLVDERIKEIIKTPWQDEEECKAGVDKKISPKSLFNGVRKGTQVVKTGLKNLFSKLILRKSGDEVSSIAYYSTDEKKLDQACEDYLAFIECSNQFKSILKHPVENGEKYLKKERTSKDINAFFTLPHEKYKARFNEATATGI